MAIDIRRNITKKRNSSCSMPGVWRAVAYSKGAVVIFHSPKACAHVTHSMDIGSSFRAKARHQKIDKEIVPLVSSLLTEKHSIFGGEKQLSECIAYVVNTYKPQYIVIAGSCVAGVIGDDIQSIATIAEEQYKIPILAIQSSGFLDGEYYAGYVETALALISRFMKKAQQSIENAVVLLGDQGGIHSEYVEEIMRLLACFGIKVINQFPSYTNYEEMNKIPMAAFNVILGGSGSSDLYLQKIAEELKKKFGTPYLGDVYPIGWNNTRIWLHHLGVFLEKEELAQKIIEQEAALLFEVMERARQKTIGKKVVLCIGRLNGYFRPQWIIELLIRLEITLRGAVVLTSYRSKDRQEVVKELKECADVEIYDEVSGEKIFKQADFILTTHEINQTNLRQLFLPLMPIPGVKGEIKMIEAIVRLLCRSSSRGGIVYG